MMARLTVASLNEEFQSFKTDIGKSVEETNDMIRELAGEMGFEIDAPIKRPAGMSDKDFEVYQKNEEDRIRLAKLLAEKNKSFFSKFSGMFSQKAWVVILTIIVMIMAGRMLFLDAPLLIQQIGSIVGLADNSLKSISRQNRPANDKENWKAMAEALKEVAGKNHQKQMEMIADMSFEIQTIDQGQWSQWVEKVDQYLNQNLPADNNASPETARQLILEAAEGLEQ